MGDLCKLGGVCEDLARAEVLSYGTWASPTLGMGQGKGFLCYCAL